MKRLSDYRDTGATAAAAAGSAVSRLVSEEDLDSPLYASPTAYGYSKIGEHRLRGNTAAATGQNRIAEQQILAGQSL